MLGNAYLETVALNLPIDSAPFGRICRAHPQQRGGHLGGYGSEEEEETEQPKMKAEFRKLPGWGGGGKKKAIEALVLWLSGQAATCL